MSGRDRPLSGWAQVFRLLAPCWNPMHEPRQLPLREHNRMVEGARGLATRARLAALGGANSSLGPRYSIPK